MTNAEIILHLIEARKMLAQGWCQGTMFSRGHNGNAYCVMGAIHSVGSASGAIAPMYHALFPDKPYVNAVDWNDAPGRTQEEVLDRVDRAIASLMMFEAADVAEPSYEKFVNA